MEIEFYFQPSSCRFCVSRKCPL